MRSHTRNPFDPPSVSPKTPKTDEARSATPSFVLKQRSLEVQSWRAQVLRADHHGSHDAAEVAFDHLARATRHMLETHGSALARRTATSYKELLKAAERKDVRTFVKYARVTQDRFNRGKPSRVITARLSDIMKLAEKCEEFLVLADTAKLSLEDRLPAVWNMHDAAVEALRYGGTQLSPAERQVLHGYLAYVAQFFSAINEPEPAQAGGVAPLAPAQAAPALSESDFARVKRLAAALQMAAPEQGPLDASLVLLDPQHTGHRVALSCDFRQPRDVLLALDAPHSAGQAVYPGVTLETHGDPQEVSVVLLKAAASEAEQRARALLSSALSVASGQEPSVLTIPRVAGSLADLARSIAPEHRSTLARSALRDLVATMGKLHQNQLLLVNHDLDATMVGAEHTTCLVTGTEHVAALEGGAAKLAHLPRFRSPELRDAQVASPQQDVWTLGISALRLLAGDVLDPALIERPEELERLHASLFFEAAQGATTPDIKLAALMALADNKLMVPLRQALLRDAPLTSFVLRAMLHPDPSQRASLAACDEMLWLLSPAAAEERRLQDHVNQSFRAPSAPFVQLHQVAKLIDDAAALLA